MNRYVLLGMLFCGILNFSNVCAWDWGKKKAKTEAVAPEKSKYEIFLETEGLRSAKGRFITVHLAGEKIYFEYPLKYMGRDLLIASTPSATSEPLLVNVGYKVATPLYVCFVREDSVVFMCEKNTYVTCDEHVKKAAEKNFMDVKKQKMKVVTYNKDRSAVVFEVTNFFTEKNTRLSPIGGYFRGLPVVGNLKADLSSVGKIKCFDDNVSIETKETYACALRYGEELIGLGDVTVNTVKNVLLLPEKKMKPRISDPRVGVFLTGKQEMSPVRGSKYYSYANRWRLEPRDMEAWERGELVEPIKPIVYYLDNTFPEAWKKPLKEGVLRWNKAFEQIGFKNAVQVRNFPLDDSDFDPDNLKYSCIRYCPVGVENAMGPSWVDPTTGEIINASVIIYNDVVKLATQWRFVQTAQVDDSIRSGVLSGERLDEALSYLVAHEVGHTLGLMHNMRASHAFPVDSLRSVSFTQKYGTTPSIMDYARFNYVAQPGDEGVKLTPPELGCYDMYAIKWLYSPVAGDKTVEEEAKIVQQWVDEKAGDPMYQYGQQQLRVTYDPSALSEDLGDDPIKAGNYGIKNLKYILPRIDAWIKDDDFSEYRMDLYFQVVNQYFGYIANVLQQVGGINLNTVKEGVSGERYHALPREVQKASMLWTIRELQESSWVDDQRLGKKALALKYSSLLRNVAGSVLFSRAPFVTFSSHLADKPYSIKDYYDDIYTGIWASVMRGGKLTEGEKALQRLCVSINLKKAKSVMLQNTRSLTGTDRGMLTMTVDEVIQSGLDASGFVRHYRDRLLEFEEEHGQGIVSEVLLLYHAIGMDPYGWQKGVNVQPIDESFAYIMDMFSKIQKLIESRLSTINPSDRAHYQSILYQIKALHKVE